MSHIVTILDCANSPTFAESFPTFKSIPRQNVGKEAKIEMSSNRVIETLEQRYIELLEKKILRLENDCNHQSKPLSLVGQWFSIIIEETVDQF